MNDGTLAVRQTVHGLLRRRLALIAIFGLLGAVATTALALSEQVQYTARSELVVGGYDLPASLALSVDPRRTGPLSIDLPAESQARIIASPVVGAPVASRLGLDSVSAKKMLDSVQVKAVTDNIYTIDVDGNTAADAAIRSNAFATEYLDYRKHAAQTLMRSLASEASDRAIANRTAAAALNATIEAALESGRDGDASSLRSEQSSLLASARTDADTSDSLLSTASGFDGGGSITRAATAEDASVSPLLLRDAVFGGILGLLLGVIVGTVLEKTSDRIRTRADAAAAAGTSVLMSIPATRSTEQAARAYLSQAELAVTALASNPQLFHAGRVVVRAVEAEGQASPVALSLEMAFRMQGRGTDVVALDQRSEEELAQARSIWDPLLSELVDRSLSRPVQIPGLEGLRVWTNTVADGQLGVSGEGSAQILLSAPHWSEDGPVGWLTPGAVTILVVRADRDTFTRVSRAARELALAGLPVVGVAMLGVDPGDGTLGAFQRQRHDGFAGRVAPEAELATYSDDFPADSPR